MPTLIIIFKVLTALVMAYRIYNIIKMFRSDSNVRLRFDLLSTLELDAVIGLSLVALLSAVKPETYGFTLGLLVVALIMNVIHSFRTIIAGDKRIMIGIKSYDFKDIKGINASRFTLHVHTKDGQQINVPVPLTQNDVLAKMKYISK